MSIAENIANIRKRMAAAARLVARNADDIRLMAVTKTFSPEAIREAYAAGVRVFGENRVQEFAAKAEALRDLADPEWHMIGHLQSNKAAKAVELFEAVDSVDSLKLAERLNAAASAAGKKLDVLIEINVGQEEEKTGIAPDSRELVPAGTPVGALPELMQDAWVAFARTGSPRTRDLPGWEPYTAARRTTLLLGTTTGSGDAPNEAERRFWDARVQASSAPA